MNANISLIISLIISLSDILFCSLKINSVIIKSRTCEFFYKPLEIKEYQNSHHIARNSSSPRTSPRCITRGAFARIIATLLKASQATITANNGRNLLILQSATMNSTWREHLEYLFAGANPNSARATVEYKATIVPERCVPSEWDSEGGRERKRKMRDGRMRARACAV